MIEIPEIASTPVVNLQRTHRVAEPHDLERIVNLANNERGIWVGGVQSRTARPLGLWLKGGFSISQHIGETVIAAQSAHWGTPLYARVRQALWWSVFEVRSTVTGGWGSVIKDNLTVLYIPMHR